MNGDTWAERVRTAVDGIENGLMTLRSLGTYGPAVDGLPELAELWNSLVVDDDIEARSAKIAGAGAAISTSGPEAMIRVLDQLDSAISDRMAFASPGEIHGVGLIRVADFGGAVAFRDLVRSDGGKVRIALGQRDALPVNHPLRDAFPEESCPGRPALIGLGPAPGGVARPFYRLRVATAVTAWLKGIETHRDQQQFARDERLRAEAARREWRTNLAIEAAERSAALEGIGHSGP